MADSAITSRCWRSRFSIWRPKFSNVARSLLTWLLVSHERLSRRLVLPDWNRLLGNRLAMNCCWWVSRLWRWVVRSYRLHSSRVKRDRAPYWTMVRSVWGPPKCSAARAAGLSVVRCSHLVSGPAYCAKVSKMEVATTHHNAFWHNTHWLTICGGSAFWRTILCCTFVYSETDITGHSLRDGAEPERPWHSCSSRIIRGKGISYIGFIV